MFTHSLSILLFSFLFSLFPVLAADRVGLVVGNSDYEHSADLGNPIRDAEAVAKRLKDGGYEVRGRLR